MRSARLDVFERAEQKADSWLTALMDDLEWDNRHQAYEALGVVLHVLRDRLPIQHAVDLGAQLPLLIRGLYYQNWDVSGAPERYRHVEEFLGRVQKCLGDHRMEYVAEGHVVDAVIRLLADRLSEGELESVQRSLPAELRILFQPSGRGDDGIRGAL